MRKNLIIIGASGHGKVVADIAIKMKKWENIYFLDDNEKVKKCLGFSVIGRIDDAVKYKDKADCFIAIGDNLIRERIQKQLEKQDIFVATLIHPQSIVGQDIEIGQGTVIMAGVVMNSSTRIGRGCIINTSSSIDHDNMIGDFVHISPGARLAGNVNIGDKSWLGIGSVVINNIEICSNSTIGAGAVIIKDIDKPGIYIGIPGKRLI